MTDHARPVRSQYEDFMRHVRDHGVTPDYVESIRDAGLSKVTPRELVRLRDHGISASYVKRAREVFMLRQVEGMSTAEVAAALDLSEDAVKARFSRARAALRGDLSERVGIASAQTFRFLRPRCDRVVAAVLARIL